MRIPLVLLMTAFLAFDISGEDIFETKVAPLLSQHCVTCHSDAQADGDLAFEDPSELINAGWVVPGDVDGSDLLSMIRPENGVAEMPKDSDPLSSDDIRAIEQWIQAGAHLPSDARLQVRANKDLDWWSLKPLATPVAELTPDVVDQFIDARLAQRGLRSLPTAEGATLIRRLSYDLTGLPPSPAEIAAFEKAYADNRKSAWSVLVDRLLDSPEFGEKWAQHWLDLARYAETHGYDKDKPREHAWPYRDYVIQSFNDDKPYGEFIREQVAGDVLSQNPEEGIAALGFLAAGPWDFIGHVEVGEAKLDGRIAKHLDRDEMISAVFNVFQSTTIQCAQCHNHKFDPISSGEYYMTHAIFAGVDRADRVYAGRTKDEQASALALEKQIKELTTRHDAIVAERQSKLDALLKPIDDEIVEITADHPFIAPPQHGYHSRIEQDASLAKWIEVDLREPVLLESIELMACYDDFNQIGAGFGFPARFKVEVCAGEAFSESESRVLFDASHEDFANPGEAVVRIDGDERPVRFVRVTATRLAERANDYIFALGELRAISAETGENLALEKPVAFSDTHPPNERWAPRFVTDDAYYAKGVPADLRHRRAELRALRCKREATVPVPPELSETKSQLQEARQQLSSIPPGRLVYSVADRFRGSGNFKPTDGKVRPIYLLRRGDLKSPVRQVLPGVPALWREEAEVFCEDFGYDETTARARLASFLAAESNPLTWRSMANRVWQWTFGAPLVGTPNDFGHMGRQPTHPELLDILAASLRDDPNQSLKQLVRVLVKTRAYRRASYVEAAEELVASNREIDADNQWLWRANRRRLTAEEYRDSVLSVAGLLQLEHRGGPSFRDFVIERPEHSPHYEYHLHNAADPESHRRTIYRFVVRSQPQPMLTSLDCADPSISVAIRDESTTAQQALTQWNSRFVEVMAAKFAERLKRERAKLSGQLTRGYKLTTGHSPDGETLSLLLSYCEAHGLEATSRVLLNSSPFLYLD